MTTNLKKIEPEADGIVKDGQTIRFRMTMMDQANQQELADKFAPKPLVADHHRPRHATVTDDQRNAAIERQKAYDKRVSDAWRGLPTDLGNTSLRTADPMMVNSAGSAANVVGAASVAELDALQAANERRYAAKISEAWKNPGAK